MKFIFLPHAIRLLTLFSTDITLWFIIGNDWSVETFERSVRDLCEISHLIWVKGSSEGGWPDWLSTARSSLAPWASQILDHGGMRHNIRPGRLSTNNTTTQSFLLTVDHSKLNILHEPRNNICNAGGTGGGGSLMMMRQQSVLVVSVCRLCWGRSLSW